MANVFDATGNYTIRRLRAPDAAYLPGAVSPGGAIPAPTVMAYGPASLTGPSGAVGAAETWGVSVAMAAIPDVAWVLIAADFLLQSKIGNGAQGACCFYPRGSISDTDQLQPPQLGPGLDLNVPFAGGAGSGGTYRRINCQANESPEAPGLWYPQDPAATRDGFTSVVLVEAEAAGLTANDLNLNLSQVRFLGFPANVWNTGALWAPAASRGS